MRKPSPPNRSASCVARAGWGGGGVSARPKGAERQQPSAAYGCVMRFRVLGCSGFGFQGVTRVYIFFFFAGSFPIAHDSRNSLAGGASV